MLFVKELLLGAKQTTQKVYSKVKGQSLFQDILCGIEEMPIQTDGHFCPRISSAPQKILGTYFTDSGIHFWCGLFSP